MSAPTVMDMTQRKGPARFGGAKGSSLRKEGPNAPREFGGAEIVSNVWRKRRPAVWEARPSTWDEEGEGAPPAPQAIRHCPRFPRLAKKSAVTLRQQKASHLAIPAPRG